MPVDRPLRNLPAARLVDLYAALQNEASGKKYNLRKELQTDKRESQVYANRWVTHAQYLEMARAELEARGLPVENTAGSELTGTEAGAGHSVEEEEPAEIPSQAE